MRNARMAGANFLRHLKATEEYEQRREYLAMIRRWKSEGYTDEEIVFLGTRLFRKEVA